jgi:hypothetical protein
MRRLWCLRTRHGGVKTRGSVLECAGPPAHSNVLRPAKSSRGLEHSKTLPRFRVPNGMAMSQTCGGSKTASKKREQAAAVRGLTLRPTRYAWV